MADPQKMPWRCPRCRAAGHFHGRGPCRASIEESNSCDGFLCHCESMGFDGPEIKANDHGTSEANPCRNSRCGHCGWSGIFPANGLDIAIGSLDLEGSFDPKTLKGWAKEAYDAGWTPPAGWKPAVEEKLTCSECSGRKRCKLHKKPKTTGGKP